MSSADVGTGWEAVSAFRLKEAEIAAATRTPAPRPRAALEPLYPDHPLPVSLLLLVVGVVVEKAAEVIINFERLRQFCPNSRTTVKLILSH